MKGILSGCGNLGDALAATAYAATGCAGLLRHRPLVLETWNGMLFKQAINKLIAYHIAFLSHKGAGADMTTPIEKMLEASVWETHSDGSTNLNAQQWPPELRFPSS